MTIDELRDAEKICILAECNIIPNNSPCDDDEECFESSGQNEFETTTMFTSIKQLTRKGYSLFIQYLVRLDCVQKQH